MSATSDTATAAPADAPPDHDHKITFWPIVKLAFRSLPFLKEAEREIKVLISVALVLLLVGLPIGFLLYDLTYTRMLQARPLNSREAWLLGLDPAVFVDVDTLDVVARQVVRNRLIVFALSVGAVIAPVVVFVYVRWVRLQQRVNQAVRVQMVQRVQAMSMRFHNRAQIGDAIYRAYQDSAMVTGLLAMLVRPLLPLYSMVATVLAMLALDVRTAIAMLVTYAILGGIAFYFGRRLRGRFRTARETNSALTSQVQETMAAIKVVKAFGTERFEQQRFERRSETAFEAAYAARMDLAVLGIITFVVAALPTVASAAYMAVWASQGKPLPTAPAVLMVTAWTLGAYQFAIGRGATGSRAAHGVAKLWGELQNLAIGMDRAFTHVDLDPEVKDLPDAAKLPELREGVAFNGVSFGYDRDRPVLHGVDLVASAGEITALCGPTGSGKSTLVSLLLRLFDPDDGRIEIDGKDIRAVQIDSLRASVAIALQENLLFGTTIAENIRYGRPEATDAEVREAARIACALEFIEELPMGFDTPLGERGSKLSTGQRQRLSIARAILKNTPVLILDEPTASLDADTELRVLENLTAWGKGRAVLLITHRLSTVRRAHKVAYLSDGRIVESGTPAELMALPDGAYRRFVELERASARAALAELKAEAAS